jgi:hypothetical protein
MASSFFLAGAVLQDLFDRHIGGEFQIEKAHHHLVPALIAPGHFFAGIRVVRIVGRIVEVRRTRDARAFRQHDRRGQVVPKLPMPVVTRHPQNRLRLARGIHDAIFEILAAPMHVRMQAGQLHGGAGFEFGVHAEIRVPRRNLEFSVGGGKRQHARPRPFLRKHQAELAAVRAGLAVRRVMDLHHEIRTGFDQLALAGLQGLRRLSRRVAHQEIAGQGAGIGAVVRHLSAPRRTRRPAHPAANANPVRAHTKSYGGCARDRPAAPRRTAPICLP